MKAKKLMALCLFFVMILSCLSGCSKTEKPQETQAPKETAAVQQTETVAETEIEEDTGIYNITWDEMAELNLVYLSAGPVPAGIADVEKAVNEITEAELNIHVNLEKIEMGSYAQQISLKMSSNETIDIFYTNPIGASSYAVMSVQNQLMPLNDLLEEYGQPIVDLVGKYMKATTLNGNIYALPIYKDLGNCLYVFMRTDVLEDLNLVEKAENIQSLKDLEEILAAVKSSEKWSNLAGLVPNSGGDSAVIINSLDMAGIDSLADSVSYDNLGSPGSMVGINTTKEDAKVELVFESDDYRKLVEYTHELYEKGYIYEDATTDKEMGSALVNQGKAFGYIAAGDIGVYSQIPTVCGRPMTCVKLMQQYVATSSVTKFTWTIPVTAKNPEAAMTFLTMLYTDARMNNLFAWGIEGRDYVVIDGVAQLPEGIENVSELAYHSADFITGNNFLVLPWGTQSADFREQQKVSLENALVSDYLGFACDTSNINNEIAAISNVIAEYGPQLNSGLASPELLDEYIEKLHKTGIDVVIEEYQKQLDAWMASK